MVNGPLPSLQPKQPSCLHTHIVRGSSLNMRNSLLVSSPLLLMSHNISASSYSTMPFDSKFPTPTTCPSTALIASVTSSHTMLSLGSTNQTNNLAPHLKNPSQILSIQTLKSATDGMADTAPQTPANTDTCASSAIRNTK